MQASADHIPEQKDTRPRALWIARATALGALIAAIYGAAHDQLSYAISPEYFTRVKFRQFAWADVGLDARAFASLVGALGSWWAGAISGYAITRLISRRRPAGAALPSHAWIARRLVFILMCAALGGATAYAWSRSGGDEMLEAWERWRLVGIRDLRAFVTVAHLHTGGYLGALAGLLCVLVQAARRFRGARSQPSILA